MNLIFNAEALRPPVTGIGYYSYHLLQEFLTNGEVQDVHCFTGTGWQDGESQRAATAALLSGDASGGGGGPGARAVHHVRQAIGMVPGTKALYDRIMEGRFERYANGIQGGVYHETNYILKPYRGPCVATVHDLSHVRYPQFHPDHVVKRLDRLLPETLARADAVITDSDVVRDDLLAHYAFPAERVHTVYLGVDERYRPRSPEECAEVLGGHDLRYGNYVLLVATLEPRKGIGLLLDAWERLPEALRREYPLVMTGSSGWRNSELEQRIERLRDEGSAKHLGYVAAADLPFLYSGAAVFAYPSVYEGFGLPALDAMSSSVPVICRAGTSMAEFARGACLLCESAQAEEFAEKLVRLLENSDERESWGRKGRARAADFSWERCARETAAIYRSIA